MATRRHVTSSSHDVHLDAAAPASSSPTDFTPKEGEKSDIAPAVPASVIIKLLGFTFAMIVGPIGTYFLTVDTIFRGNSTFAGATAAIMANVVLVAYVVVAMREDNGEPTGAAGSGSAAGTRGKGAREKGGEGTGKKEL